MARSLLFHLTVMVGCVKVLAKATETAQDRTETTEPKKSLNGNRSGRRRQERGEDNEGVSLESYPNYPPPSFLEATSVPTSNSNTTLAISQPASPLTPDVPVLESLPLSPHTPIPASSMPLESQTETDADSDTSLEIIDMNQLPAHEQLPSGSQLEENIKRDWRHRRGVEFPSPPESQRRDSSKTRGRAVLDLDTKDATEDVHSSRPSTPKHRALSPLRTLFPYRSMAVDQPLSASPNPSPYSSHHPSSPFSSATSLKMSMSTTSITSVKGGEGFLSKRLLSFKGKERAKESLDTWEVVDSHPDACPSSESHTSPTRSQSFTYGMPVVSNHANQEAKSVPKPTPATTNVIPPHPLSLRDRKPPPVPTVTRPKRKAPPPPPKPAQVVPVPQGPILTSVRTRKPPPPPPPPPQKLGHLISSPLGHDSWRPLSLDVDAESNSVLQRAMTTPLPLSPTEGLSGNVLITPSTPAVAGPAATVSLWTREPIPPVPTLPLPVSGECPNAGSQHMPGEYFSHNEYQIPIFAQPSNHVDDLLPSLRRHYPGRPLPRPPSATRSLVDSTYGIHEPRAQTSSNSQCPEGLLIDLDSPPVLSNPPTPRINDEHSLLARPSYATSSSSSVDLLGSITDMDTPVIPRHPSPNHSEPVPTPNEQTSTTPYSEITDLDVLVSRISENESQDGSDYDALLLLSEFIGPASPPRTGTNPTLAPTPHAPLPTRQQARPNPTSIPEPLGPTPNVPLRGSVRVERRRTTKDGRVKLKLGLLDAVVDKCGICLTQFRSDDAAQLGSVCRHAFHEKCLGRWLVRSKTCPLCRVSFQVALERAL
ncbi:hypothetical protein H0H92_015629 [Tricholoma furcatifolium]|nr:hypothetical protein H0H92_015629 [Tricholoma furcatifolium]